MTRASSRSSVRFVWSVIVWTRSLMTLTMRSSPPASPWRRKRVTDGIAWSPVATHGVVCAILFKEVDVLQVNCAVDEHLDESLNAWACGF